MNSNHTTRLGSITLAALALVATGCYDTSLPASFEVKLPDGTTVTAQAGGGVPSQVDSKWAVNYNDSYTGPVARIEFGPNGEVLRVFDQTIAPNALGDTIIPDGTSHPGAVPGLTYVGRFYGAENASGFGIVGVGKAFLGPIELATTEWQVFGTVVGDDFKGTMIQSTKVNPQVASLGIFNNFDAQDSIIARPDQALDEKDEPNNTSAQATALTIGESRTEAIDPAGDEDWFIFTIDKPISLTVETKGTSGDTVLSLFDGNLNFLGWNDDGGMGHFSRMTLMDLPAGTYYVKVASYDGSAISQYSIRVSPFAAPTSQPTI